MLHIAIPIFDGVDELDAIGPFEVLRNAAHFAALSCELIAAQPVTASHGLQMSPTATLDTHRWDCLIVPGGNWARPDSLGVRTQIVSGDLPRLIGALHQQKTLLASVCTGAMMLSSAGILRGRNATTHQVAKRALAKEGATLIDARVVDDGDIVTAGGVTSGIDLALYLLSRWFGIEIARRVQELMEHQPVGEVWRGGAMSPLDFR